MSILEEITWNLPDIRYMHDISNITISVLN